MGIGTFVPRGPYDGHILQTAFVTKHTHIRTLSHSDDCFGRELLLYHRFRVHRCKMWPSKSGRDDFVDLPDDLLRNKVICSVNFVGSAFINFRNNRLIRSAVPRPWNCQEVESGIA